MENKDQKAPINASITITKLPDGRIETTTNIQDKYRALGLIDIAKASLLNSIMGINDKGRVEEKSPEFETTMKPVKQLKDDLDAE